MNPLSLSYVAEKREMKCWSPARTHEQEKWIRIPKAIESPSNSFNDSLKGKKKKQKKKNKSQKKKKERKTFTPRENRSRVRHTSQLSCCWHWKIQLSKFFLAHVHISHARAEFSGTVVFLVDQRGGRKRLW